MTDVISRSDAENIIGPHKEAISACLYNAWDQWAATDLATTVRPGTRANLVYDYAVAEAWRLLRGREGLALTEQRGFLCDERDRDRAIAAVRSPAAGYLRHAPDDEHRRRISPGRVPT